MVLDNEEEHELLANTSTGKDRTLSHEQSVEDAKEQHLSQDEANNDQNSSTALGEDEIEYPSSWKLALITVGLGLSVLCMALDNTIIATAIPRITDHFNAVGDVGWYGSAYLLATCCVQLIFGKLYAFYSIKWVYLSAMFVFELGSFVCGITPTSLGLIIGRAVAGIGSAGIYSGALLIISRITPLSKRPMYLGLIGSMYGIASVAGPLMGGAFTDKLSWRWCFYINLPFGAVTALFIIIFFHPPDTKTERGNLTWKEKARLLDIEGSAMFIPGVICLLLALQWGGTTYAWGSGRIIALFVVFGILIVAFIGIQIWKQERATVPPRIMKKRTIWGSTAFAACIGAAFFIMVYYIPMWFQAIKGVNAVRSGIMNLPLVLGVVAFSLIAGVLVTFIGYYAPIMIIASIIATVGAGLMTTFHVETPQRLWIGYQFIFGMGVGLGMQQPMMAVQSCLQGDDTAIGTALLVFCQTLGGAISVAVGENVFENKLVSNIVAANITGLDPSIVLNTGATAIQSVITKEDLPAVLVAYNAALTSTFYVAVATGALSIIGALSVEWISVKGKKIEVAAA